MQNLFTILSLESKGFQLIYASTKLAKVENAFYQVLFPYITSNIIDSIFSMSCFLTNSGRSAFQQLDHITSFLNFT